MRLKKVKPIKKELVHLLEGFLNYPEYQELFKQFAKAAGYNGNNKDRIKKVLFMPNDDAEIIFTVSGLYELFTEYQLLLELSNKEPYKSLLKEYPEAIRNIRAIAIKALNGDSLTEEDLNLIFNTDVYDKKRNKPREDNSSEQIQTQPNGK